MWATHFLEYEKLRINPNYFSVLVIISKENSEKNICIFMSLCFRSAAESLSNQNEAELQRRLAERQEEISHMQEVLEAKVQLLQEVETHVRLRTNQTDHQPVYCRFIPAHLSVQEAELARGDAQRMASLADSEAQRCLALEREMVERMEESGGSAGRLPPQAADDKDRCV